jgi:hypothetical protein
MEKISDNKLTLRLINAEKIEDWELVFLLLELKQKRAEFKYQKVISEFSVIADAN